MDGHTGISPTTFVPHVLVDSPCNFPFPDISVPTGVSWVSLLALSIVGLHPAGLQALYLSILETKERAPSQWQRQQWFNGWGNLSCLKQGPEVTPTMCSRWQAGHASSASLNSWSLLPDYVQLELFPLLSARSSSYLREHFELLYQSLLNFP